MGREGGRLIAGLSALRAGATGRPAARAANGGGGAGTPESGAARSRPLPTLAARAGAQCCGGAEKGSGTGGDGVVDQGGISAR